MGVRAIPVVGEVGLGARAVLPVPPLLVEEAAGVGTASPQAPAVEESGVDKAHKISSQGFNIIVF